MASSPMPSSVATAMAAAIRFFTRSPGQNGSRERGFGSLKYERLFLEEIDDVLAVVKHADAYRVEHNTVRPHEAIAWNRPIQIHPGLVGPRIPNFPRDRKPANYLTRDTTTQQRPRPGVFDQRLWYPSHPN